MLYITKVSLSRDFLSLSERQKKVLRSCPLIYIYVMLCMFVCACVCDNKKAKPQKLETKSAERIGLSARVSLL